MRSLELEKQISLLENQLNNLTEEIDKQTSEAVKYNKKIERLNKKISKIVARKPWSETQQYTNTLPRAFLCNGNRCQVRCAVPA